MDKIKKANDNISVQVKATTWYAICNILQKGIAAAVLPIYTRMLTTAEYGSYSVFMSWRDIIIIFATLNLYCGVFTKAMIDYKNDRDRYVSAIQGLSTVCTLIVFVIFMCIKYFSSNILKIDRISTLLMFAYFVGFPAISFWSCKQRVELKYKRMVVLTLVISVITPLISIILFKIVSPRDKAAIWGGLIVYVSVGLFLYILQFIKGKCFFHKIYWVKALRFNIPLIPHYLSLIVLGQADRIMIEHYCGSEKAGIYSLVYQVSLAINVAANAINNSLVPWIYDKLKNYNFNSIKEKSKVVVSIIALVAIITMYIAPEIICVLGTKEYLDAVSVVPAIVLGAFFAFCYGLFVNIEFYYNATRYVMIASMTGAIINIVLNATFIPMYGYLAAGYTTMFCYLIFLMMHYFFMKEVCEKEEISVCEVFDIKSIVYFSLFLCVCSAVIMKLYSFRIIRYVIFAVMIIIMYVKRTIIVSTIKETIGRKQ